MRRPYHEAKQELARTRKLVQAARRDKQFGTEEVARILAEEEAVRRVRRHEKRHNDVRAETLLADVQTGTRKMRVPEVQAQSDEDKAKGRQQVKMVTKEVPVYETQLLPRAEATLAMHPADRAALNIIETRS